MPCTAPTRPRSTHRLAPAFITLLALVLCMPDPSVFAQSAQSANGRIDVVVARLRSSQGALGCQLFASATGFPSQSERAVAAQVAPIADGSARCSFANLPAGAYAVAVVHDENGNRKLDTNLLGIPTEGYGVSNNRTHAMSAPRWDESRVELAEGEAKQLAITLRY